MKKVKYENLDQAARMALDAAERVLMNAYNPYSHFYVGAALFTDNGKIITGSNFENAAFGSTICAERAAVLRGNALGIRCFKGIAIIARGEDFDTMEVTAPCGSCRQVLYEVSQISGNDLKVILSTSKKDKIVITSIKELLPLAFGPLDFGIDIAKFQK
jgi:cytidine deaminase